MSTTPGARPVIDRLGEAHGLALALAQGQGSAAIAEQIVAAMAASYALAAELDATRADLIRLRHYIVRHGLLIGECVAWHDLKKRYGVGRDWDAEDGWLEAYDELQAMRGGPA